GESGPSPRRKCCGTRSRWRCGARRRTATARASSASCSRDEDDDARWRTAARPCATKNKGWETVMREELLEILTEPVTDAPLTLKNARGARGVIDEGELVSELTGKSYPIVRGIPRFVPKENYAESFGFQWNKFREVQVDSATKASHSRSRFEAETGWTS